VLAVMMVTAVATFDSRSLIALVVVLVAAGGWHRLQLEALHRR